MGQDGPLSQRAGHDINYLSMAGALHPIGPADREPVVPLNLVADSAAAACISPPASWPPWSSALAPAADR